MSNRHKRQTADFIAEQMREQNRDAFTNMAEGWIRMTFPQEDWDSWTAKHFGTREAFEKVFNQAFGEPPADPKDTAWKDPHRMDELSEDADL